MSIGAIDFLKNIFIQFNLEQNYQGKLFNPWCLQIKIELPSEKYTLAKHKTQASWFSMGQLGDI